MRFTRRILFKLLAGVPFVATTKAEQVPTMDTQDATASWAPSLTDIVYSAEPKDEDLKRWWIK